MLDDEFNMLDKLFNDEIFLEISGCQSNDFFNIISIDTIDLKINTKNDYYVSPTWLLLVKVKTHSNYPGTNLSKRKESLLINDILTYYVLLNQRHYYKMFGFYNSDILLFVDQVGIGGVESLAKNLYKNNILNKKETRVFKRTLNTDSKEYPSKLHKPCEFLKYYFDKDEMHKANTKILPLKPLRPFVI